jgi:hypothetical protein
MTRSAMRTADKPEGPWSAAQTLVTSASVRVRSSQVDGSDLYFTLLLWSNYSVMLMRTRCPQPPCGGSAAAQR